jgi:hypothetical protein
MLCSRVRCLGSCCSFRWRLCRLCPRSQQQRTARDRKGKAGEEATTEGRGEGKGCTPRWRVPLLVIRLAACASRAPASVCSPACCPSAGRPGRAKPAWGTSVTGDGRKHVRTAGPPSSAFLPRPPLPLCTPLFSCAPSRVGQQRCDACVPAGRWHAGVCLLPTTWNRHCGTRCLGGEAAGLYVWCRLAACAHAASRACSSQQHSLHRPNPAFPSAPKRLPLAASFTGFRRRTWHPLDWATLLN